MLIYNFLVFCIPCIISLSLSLSFSHTHTHTSLSLHRITPDSLHGIRELGSLTQDHRLRVCRPNPVFTKNWLIVIATTCTVRITKKKKKFNMNTQMGTSWEYKMHQYLVGQGYWSYVEGVHKNQPNPAHANHPTWEQAVSRVLYCLGSCIHDHTPGYIRDVKTPKETWGTSKRYSRATQPHENFNSIRS